MTETKRPALQFGDGDYSCATCGLGMEKPCVHWEEILAAQPASPSPFVGINLANAVDNLLTCMRDTSQLNRVVAARDILEDCLNEFRAATPEQRSGLLERCHRFMEASGWIFPKSIHEQGEWNEAETKSLCAFVQSEINRAAQPEPMETLRSICEATHCNTTDDEGNPLKIEELKAKIISSANAGWREYNRVRASRAAQPAQGVREAIIKYGQHIAGCDWWRGEKEEYCSCGFGPIKLRYLATQGKRE